MQVTCVTLFMLGRIVKEGSGSPLFMTAGVTIGGLFYLKDKIANTKPDAKSQNLQTAPASSVEVE
jgi:hypothetical protein